MKKLDDLRTVLKEDVKPEEAKVKAKDKPQNHRIRSTKLGTDYTDDKLAKELHLHYDFAEPESGTYRPEARWMTTRDVIAEVWPERADDRRFQISVGRVLTAIVNQYPSKRRRVMTGRRCYLMPTHFGERWRKLHGSAT